MRALIIGATGSVGKHLLREILASSHFERVGEFGRRVTAGDDFEMAWQRKLVQKQIDFDKLEDEEALRIGKWDVVFITLGTTRASAGSAEAFLKIDQDYVINVAKLVKDPSLKQRLVYLSSAGANPSSYFLYPQSKGRTEETLASLGYDDVLVFRPGLLTSTERPEKRLGETIAEAALGIIPTFKTSYSIPVDLLAKGIRHAGELGSANLPASAAAQNVGSFKVIGNGGARALAGTTD